MGDIYNRFSTKGDKSLWGYSGSILWFNNAYVNLPIKNNASYAVECTYCLASYPTGSSASIVVVGNTANDNHIKLTIYNGTYYYSKGTTEGSFSAANTQGTHTIEFNPHTNAVVFDGSSISTYTPSGIGTSEYLTIGNRNGTTGLTGGIVEYKITDTTNNIIIADYIPRTVDHHIGLYDTVSSSFIPCGSYMFDTKWMLYAQNILLPYDNFRDPIPVYSKYNIGHTFSGYSIYDGKLTSEFQWYFANASGHEGICLDINSFNLTAGKTYTMRFTLTIPSGTVFETGSYPFGIKYSNTTVTASSTAFNQTPDVNFVESIGDQSVSITFTADTTNYMLLCMDDVNSASNLFLMKYIRFNLS